MYCNLNIKVLCILLYYHTTQLNVISLFRLSQFGKCFVVCLKSEKGVIFNRCETVERVGVIYNISRVT